MHSSAIQLRLPVEGCPISVAVDTLAESESQARGAVFTKREVAEFILDLIGYTPDQPLWRFRLLEPAVGCGDFMLPAVDRLLSSYHGDTPEVDLANALRAVEIHKASLDVLKVSLVESIMAAGHDIATAWVLVDAWLVQGDFLLADISAGYTHVVGNPPYVRQEDIPAPLLSEYRARYATIYDRADLYVPFYERALSLLAEGGRLGFICSDRWMKNRYGGPLRELVTRGFHLSTYVDMVGTPAFQSDVIAYPAITVIVREPAGDTRIARRPEISARVLRSLARELGEHGTGATECIRLPAGNAPWLFESAASLRWLRYLEAEFPLLEDAGCKVGIGVATGADRAFIAPMDALDVEEDRKLPLVTTRDIREGSIHWRGLGVINPFRDEGGVVDLRRYPRLSEWLQQREDIIRRRNVARRNPDAWFRTIDRINPMLVGRPKLLIPDIKGDAHIVFDEGRYYPHHNLYYIVSEEWDLLVLQAVLQSGVARMFVAAYSVRMQGGHLRFQAQNLRRIRLPRWGDISGELRSRLMDAVRKGDEAERDRLIPELYGLRPDEWSVLMEGANR